jgi:ligand-binding sensor domain-containing protein
MRRILALLFLSILQANNAQAIFNRVQGIEDARIRRVAISRKDPSFVAVASKNNLYFSEDGGDHYRRVLGLKDEQTTHMFIDNDDPSPLVYFAGTRHGYRVGERIEKIFSAKDDEIINFISKHDNHIYVATSSGLYRADASLLNWKSVSALGEVSVNSMTAVGNLIYLACDSGVYRLQPDETAQRLFITRNSEGSGLVLHQIQADTQVPSRLWLCTNKGIFYSTDKGDTWQKFYVGGVGNISVYSLVQPPKQTGVFYICTDAGLFMVDINEKESHPLFEGLSSSETFWMDFTADGKIYLSTAKGLFTNQIHTPEVLSTPDCMDTLLKGEPPIQLVQEAALHYNAVHPEKTGKWRRKLKYKALLPTLSIDYDNYIRGTVGKDYDNFASGPHEWGVSLSWDIGDLVWHPAETTIDNRTKLTTQQRIDILDEINRLYFERLRLKREILAMTLGEDITSKKIRLMELTATLDSYTGGYFSQNADHSPL